MLFLTSHWPRILGATTAGSSVGGLGHTWVGPGVGLATECYCVLLRFRVVLEITAFVMSLGLESAKSSCRDVPIMCMHACVCVCPHVCVFACVHACTHRLVHIHASALSHDAGRSGKAGSMLGGRTGKACSKSAGGAGCLKTRRSEQRFGRVLGRVTPKTTSHKR